MAILATQAGEERVEIIGYSTAPTPGATVTIDLSTLAKVYAWTAGEDETVNASGTQKKGQELTCIITNDGNSSRTITFGTGFKAASTVVGTTSKAATVTFRSNGTYFYEIARTVEIS